MELFTKYNTDGYTNLQLDELNAEWGALADKDGLEEFTEEYNQKAKEFADEVGKR